MTGDIITPAEALIGWITALQTHELEPPPRLMVRGDDGDWFEVDYFQDDPTNLIDETWEQPVLVYADETS